MTIRWAIFATAAFALCACTPTRPLTGRGTPTSGGEAITVSVGPCFGFCPVWSAKVSPDGSVLFSGQRHTVVVGDRRKTVGRSGYNAISRKLAPFRPVDGSTAAVACDAAISDTSTYVITWTDEAGGDTVATHQTGCTGGPGKALDDVLRGLPGQLGVADWAKQMTRPGEGRG